MESAYATDFDSTDSEHDKLKQRFEGIVNRLEREAEQRVAKRRHVEKRWIEDLAQYHGKYDEETQRELDKNERSSLYINSTRPKTNAMASRLSDMLFPTDDRNWGIKPTPVPELTVEAERAARAAAESAEALAANPQDQRLIDEANDAATNARTIQAQMQEAKDRARAMQEEIDDHLRRVNYAAQARLVIEDACKIGSGIFKGPVIGDRNRPAWQKNDNGEFVMRDTKDTRPSMWRVDPWNFFPDFDATCIEDGEGNYERHLLNRKQLKRLARQPGFDKKAIRHLLEMGAESTTPTYISDLRSITGAYHESLSDRYHVWEYHGPLSREDMRDLAMMTANENVMKDLDGIEDDPLAELEVVIWFCQGTLLKFGLHWLDSGEPIYSVYCLDKDDASVFGFGVPYIMRDPQRSMAAAWRMLLDNAGLSSGPQVVVFEDIIEPVDGNWTLRPHKVWRRKAGVARGEKAFEVFEIKNNTEQMLQLIEVSKKNVDEETAIPVIAQGEQGTHVTKTAHGMSLLMNSVNVVFRRLVKNWDDDVTTPILRRTYDFLMQFSEKEHIKGDFEVDARGTSVLLVREMQSQNLMLFLNTFSGHPLLGKYLKEEGLEGLRQLARTLQLSSNDLIKSDDEISQDRAEAAQNPPPIDIEAMKIEAEMNDRERQREHDMTVAQMKLDAEMLALAQQGNVKLEEIANTLQNAREQRLSAEQEARRERESKERIVATEAAVAKQQGVSSGGYV